MNVVIFLLNKAFLIADQNLSEVLMSTKDSRRMSIGPVLVKVNWYKTLKCLTVNSVAFITASRTTE